MTFTATGRSTAHTKCRNEVEDLERSVELCGRAVADNENEAGGTGQKILMIRPSAEAIDRGRETVYAIRKKNEGTSRPITYP